MSNASNTVYFAEYPAGYHFADSIKELGEGFTKLGNPHIQVCCKLQNVLPVDKMSTEYMKDAVEYIHGGTPTDDFFFTKVFVMTKEEKELAFT